MKKGFTLVELIAVILVLGIIALIAVPRISNAIQTSKEKTATISMQNYVHALEQKILVEKYANGVYSMTDIDVEVSGDKPTSATIETSQKEIQSVVANYGGITISFNKGEGITIIK